MVLPTPAIPHPPAAYDDRDNTTFQVVRQISRQSRPPASNDLPSTSSPGTATTRPGNTTWPASLHQHCQPRPPDPSIYTVLTSRSDSRTANVDFATFPRRWTVAEHRFRPPWFHRNFMDELMGLVDGEYDAKARRLCPRRSQSPQLHERRRARRRDLRKSQHRRVEARQSRGDPASMSRRFVCRPAEFAMETAAVSTSTIPAGKH